MMKADAFLDLVWKENTNETIKTLILENKSYLHLSDEDGTVVLISASTIGNLELVQFLLKQGANINHRTNNNYTALAIASTNHHFKVVDYLINQGADLNIFPNYYSYKSFLAIYFDRFQYSWQELQSLGLTENLIKTTIDQSKDIGFDSLRELLYANQLDSYYYALKNKRISQKDALSSLVFLFYTEDAPKALEIIKKLLKNKIIHLNDQLPDYSITAFQLLVQSSLKAYKQNPKIVEMAWDFMLEHGANLKEYNNETILLKVAESGHVKAFEYFLQKGANLQFAPEFHYHALFAEVENSNYQTEKEVPEMFKYLVDQGIDLTLKLERKQSNMFAELSKFKRKKSIKYIFTKVIQDVLLKRDENNHEAIFHILFDIQQYASSKKEKECMIQALLQFPKFSKEIAENTTNPKAKLREIAVKTLIALDKPEHLVDLKDCFEVESNKGILTALEAYLKTK